ncbi:DUF4199 domain-containing protein [Pontimicrobium aquaticum]|uniref:DUF4199 domain-containing protein n=1 Tax=Pontimicrobium aquaticum TaxID=2565367 RepID=A0A4U0EW24_9FLAO|nr:DUF4199 domain-containing protein [Pontimicrobium aquaticum]TJY36146.1 DUF4199 domain-containing protein [Pontimicrobium aquaticum]
MENSIKSSALNYGLYLGGALALITVAIYAIDLSLMVNMWLGIFLILIIVGFGVVSTAKSKGILEGFLSFKQAFTSYFITVVVGITISTVISALLFNFIDPEAAIQMKEMTVQATINMLEGFGAPPESIAEAVEKIENQNQFGIGALIQNLIWSFVIQAILGLIVAAIMKRSNPDA